MNTQEWSVSAAETVVRDIKPLMSWHYETGCILKALEQVWLKTGDDKYFDVIQTVMDELVQPGGQIKGYTLEEYNLDQINTGKILFLLYRKSGAEKYGQAIEVLRTQMKGHPRTSEGGFWHKKIYPYQMWLDGLYMAAPFLAQYAQTFGELDLMNDVALQILLMERHARDPVMGLLCHGWDESGEQEWANPSTGCSPHFWGRAMGWYSMAIVDVLDYLPLDHPKRGEIIGIFRRMIVSLAKFQDPTTGLWYQILDQGDRAGNYREASASAMFIYAILKGVGKHYLEDGFKDIARKAFSGMIHDLIKVDDQGLLQLHNICGCAGLGGNPYRDGSYEYYVGEKVVVNDLKGLAPFIMASIEWEKLKE